MTKWLNGNIVEMTVEVNGFGAETTPIRQGTGYIYVPFTLVEAYKAADNWSTFANQIRAIEDYPIGGAI